MTVPVQISSNLLGAIGGVPRPDVDVVVDARDVNKYFGRLHVLKDVCIQVKRQETVVIIGPSGSGKTTFIRCINHLEKIQGGRIFVNGHLIGYRETPAVGRIGRLIAKVPVVGRPFRKPVGATKLVEDKEKNIARQRQEIGMVFQRFNLFPHMTALENIIEAPIHVRGMARDEAVVMGRALLERVGLAAKETIARDHDSPDRLQGQALDDAVRTRARIERRRAFQGLPDPLPHRRGARRHRRFARQHERGQLALPLLRHRQGQRLAR